MRLDYSSEFCQRNNKLVQASYLVAYEIEKQKKSTLLGNY